MLQIIARMFIVGSSVLAMAYAPALSPASAARVAPVSVPAL
jgi:hypothetical protein